jgi:MFS family permease
MDTLGAAIGPTLSLLFLLYFPHHYKTIFLLAFIPGLISVALVFLVREKRQKESTMAKGNFFSFFRYWNIAKPEYKQLVAGLAFLALFNSSDVFLLLKTKQITQSDSITIGAYIAYNIVFALASYPLGILADRIGLKKVFLGGLILFAIAYFLFGFTSSTAVIFISFFIYGLFAAASEGITRAWISNMAGGRDTATAIGFYTSCESICTLLASIIAGFLWNQFGSESTFFTTSAAAVIVFFYLITVSRSKKI